MIIAAVSQRVDFIAKRDEYRDALDQRLTLWLLAAGVLAVPVPNAMRTELPAWLDAIQPSLVVLSGGNDIGEDLGRDNTEHRLLDWAKRLALPALGICRGMQLMSVHAGGDLQTIENHVGQPHSLLAEPAAHGIWPPRVNSFHSQGIRNCPPGFEVQARADDGSIEAIRQVTLPWEGWMWHPEREPDGSAIETQRLRDLLRLSSTKSGKHR